MAEIINANIALREDIKIILNAKNKSGEKKDLSWLGISEAELTSDIWMYIVGSKAPGIMKYKERWYYSKWENTDDNRKQHRAWISLYVKDYLSKLLRKRKLQKRAEQKYWEEIMANKIIDSSYSEVAELNLDEAISLVKNSTTNELEEDMVKWKMEMYSREEVAEKHGISLNTLYRRWNKFKARVVYAYIESMDKE